MPNARTPIIWPIFSSRVNPLRVVSAHPEGAGAAARGLAGGCGGGLMVRKHEIAPSARDRQTADADHGLMLLGDIARDASSWGGPFADPRSGTSLLQLNVR